ncbi:MAG: DinB family protein [Chloroflexi bacterium]|nr:DinB family protein [Chloroflexota bacterium]
MQRTGVPVLQEFREKLQSHRLELLRLLKTLTEERASRYLHPEWSVKQQLAHIIQAEKAWLTWALALRKEPGLTFGQTPEQGQIFVEEVNTAHEYPLGYWTTRLKAVRAQTILCLSEANLTAEDLEQKGTHRTFGEMTVLQAFRALYRHDRMHLDQILGREQQFVPGSRAPS